MHGKYSDLYISPEAMKDIQVWPGPEMDVTKVEKPCPDCKDGKYYGFAVVENCKTCNGTLKVCEYTSKEPEKPEEKTKSYEFGMGYERACQINLHSDIDFSLPNIPQQSGLITKFETNLPYSAWKTQEALTIGDFYERLFTYDDFVEIKFNFGYNLKFKVNNDKLKKRFKDVEDTINNIKSGAYMKYEELDKILGAYT